MNNVFPNPSDLEIIADIVYNEMMSNAETRSQEHKNSVHQQYLERNHQQYLEETRSEVRSFLKSQREEVTEGLLGLSLTAEQLRNIENHYQGDPLLRLRTRQESLTERIVMHSSKGHSLAMTAHNMGLEGLSKETEIELIQEQQRLVAEQNRCNDLYNSLMKGNVKSNLLADSRLALERHGLPIPKSTPPSEIYLQSDDLSYGIESALDLHQQRIDSCSKLEKKGESLGKNVTRLIQVVAITLNLNQPEPNRQ